MFKALSVCASIEAFVSIFCPFCLQSKIQDKKTNVEAAVELAKMAFGSEDIRVTHAKEIAMECSGINDPERCEGAVKMYRCSLDAGAKRGLKVGDLL